MLSKTVNDFLSTLPKELKIKTADNIVSRYNENKRNSSLKLMKQALFNNDLKNLSSIFSRWKDSKYIRQKSGRNESAMKTKCNVSTVNQSYTSSSIVQQDFMTRQKTFTDQVKKKKEQYLNDKENLNCELCPFTPTLITKSSKYTSNKNPFKRLYEDSTRRTLENSKRQNKIMQDIKNQSSWRSKNATKAKSATKRILGEKLYNDYKVYLNKKKYLQKEIDNERGISFRPSTNHNNIKGNSKQMLTENNIDDYNHILYGNKEGISNIPERRFITEL